ncbi:MAG: thermonuclease family protein [Clostridiales bacterium]|nr:thermonuclease family protein [Clostridiales bacterium]
MRNRRETPKDIQRAALLATFLILASTAGYPDNSISILTESFPGSGTVLTVYDGDTIKVKFVNGSESRVRLIGVDAPELDDSREKVHLNAQLAKRFSFFHLYQKKIKLSYDQTPVDRHGRILAYVWLDGGVLYNEFIIRQGFAAAFFAFPFRGDYQERFREAQKEAREQGRGLWIEGKPEEIPSSSAGSYLGKLISVRFLCSKARKSRSFLYLESADGSFEALIPRDYQANFSLPETLTGRLLIATGFLEEFRGRPQILLFFSRQLRQADILDQPH